MLREKLKRYVEYEEMDIVGEYSDEGHSGKNITDKFYDRKYQDMADRQDQLYEQIGAYEEKIESVTKRIENIKQDKISGEAIYIRFCYSLINFMIIFLILRRKSSCSHL